MLSDACPCDLAREALRPQHDVGCACLKASLMLHHARGMVCGWFTNGMLGHSCRHGVACVRYMHCVIPMHCGSLMTASLHVANGPAKVGATHAKIHPTLPHQRCIHSVQTMCNQCNIKKLTAQQQSGVRVLAQHSLLAFWLVHSSFKPWLMCAAVTATSIHLQPSSMAPPTSRTCAA